MKINEIKELFPFEIKKILPCGSRVTCKPPIMDTDEDWLIFFQSKDIYLAKDLLQNKGFLCGGSFARSNDDHNCRSIFWSFTRKNINFIISADADFCLKFELATKIAKKLNIMKKSDRISLFQLVLYDNE